MRDEVMMLGYYKTIRAALDASFNAVCRHMNVTPTQAPDIVKQHLQTMSKEWRTGSAPNIAYSEPICRFAYLYCHTAANANLCELAIREVKGIAQHVTNVLDEEGELKVCAFGGGPGTELLAISKHLIKTRSGGPHGRISFTLLDKVPEWSETWHALEGEIKQALKTKYGTFAKQPFSTSGTFIPFDMTKVAQYANLSTIFTQDMFVLNYVVSELAGDRSGFQKLITLASKAAPSGAMFLIIDRDQDWVIDASKEMLTKAKLKVTPVKRPSRNLMDNDEDPNVLKKYQDMVAWKPRRWWCGTYGTNSGKGAFFLAGEKP